MSGVLEAPDSVQTLAAMQEAIGEAIHKIMREHMDAMNAACAEVLDAQVTDVNVKSLVYQSWTSIYLHLLFSMLTANLQDAATDDCQRMIFTRIMIDSMQCMFDARREEQVEAQPAKGSLH